jgi:YfiH family protein
MFITCPELSKHAKIRHGFFTRNGGVSEGLYASLNCGPGSGDSLAAVAENRARVAASLGAPADSLCTAHQVHSGTAVILEKPWQHADAPQADALVTNVPGIVLGVLSADCLPVLFSDEKARVIGAAHSGWKGAIGGVLDDTIAKMESLGAKKTDIIATIGPAIAQISYEVGAEFLANLTAQDANNSKFFINSNRPNHYLFDLKGYAKSRLLKAGISAINVLAHDTCLLENDFFSFRRATHGQEPVYGRQISAITLEH